jgi:hypothetical protein
MLCSSKNDDNDVDDEDNDLLVIKSSVCVSAYFGTCIETDLQIVKT